MKHYTNTYLTLVTLKKKKKNLYWKYLTKINNCEDNKLSIGHDHITRFHNKIKKRNDVAKNLTNQSRSTSHHTYRL